MMSRKIDRINDLTVLPGDGGKVLVGGKMWEFTEEMWEFTGKKCGSLRENGGQNWDLRLGKVTDQLWVQ